MAMDQDQLFQVLKGFKADLESSLTTQLANVMADARAQTQGLENQLAATQRVVEERMNVMEANVRTMASQAAAQAVTQAGQVASAVATEQVSAVLNRVTTSTPAGGTTTTAGPGTVSGAGAGAGLARESPIVVYTQPHPTLLPNAPVYDGTRPGQEDISAQGLLSFMEVYRTALDHPMSDRTLILQTASRFKRNGRAFNWWTNRVQRFDKDPIMSWDAFRVEFLEAMKGPEEAVQLRLRLSRLEMEGDELYEYIAQIRSIVNQLNSYAKPEFHISEGEAVLHFARGLPTYLADRVSLSNPSLEDAINRVTAKASSRQLSQMMRGPRAMRIKSKGRLAVIDDEYADGADAADDDGAWGSEEADEDEELCVVRTKRVGKRPGRGGRGGRGAGSGASGRGRGNRSGVSRAEVQDRLRKNLCLACGAQGHWARDCPTRAQSENKPA